MAGAVRCFPRSGDGGRVAVGAVLVPAQLLLAAPQISFPAAQALLLGAPGAGGQFPKELRIVVGGQVSRGPAGRATRGMPGPRTGTCTGTGTVVAARASGVPVCDRSERRREQDE